MTVDVAVSRDACWPVEAYVVYEETSLPGNCAIGLLRQKPSLKYRYWPTSLAANGCTCNDSCLCSTVGRSCVISSHANFPRQKAYKRRIAAQSSLSRQEAQSEEAQSSGRAVRERYSVGSFGDSRSRQLV